MNPLLADLDLSTGPCNGYLKRTFGPVEIRDVKTIFPTGSVIHEHYEILLADHSLGKFESNGRPLDAKAFGFEAALIAVGVFLSACAVQAKNRDRHSKDFD